MLHVCEGEKNAHYGVDKKNMYFVINLFIFDACFFDVYVKSLLISWSTWYLYEFAPCVKNSLLLTIFVMVKS